MDLIAWFEVQASQSHDPELKAFAAERLPAPRKHYKKAIDLQETYASALGRQER